MLIVSLYNLLGISQRLQDESFRLLYLKDNWGLDQKTIAHVEGRSQPYISGALRKARNNVNVENFQKSTDFKFEAHEIKQVQFLPRDMITDTQVMAFIVDLLGVQVSHPFYNYYSHNPTTRMIALSSLGIQQKKLAQIYKKSQNNISMQVKKGLDKVLAIEYVGRYDDTAPFMLIEKKEPNKFIPAGGSTFVW